MLEWIKKIEVYNCVGNTVLGSYVEIVLGVGLGGGTVWEEIITVGLVPRGAPVDSLVK